MKDLLRAAPYVRMHRDRILVLKAGGAVLGRPALVARLAKQVAVVQALGARVVLVHGGGPQTDAVQRLLGEQPNMIDGRRVTSPAALRALRMATAGELNGDLCAALRAEGAAAIGVCAGASGLLVATRRPPMATSAGVVDFGEVGDLVGCDPAPLLALLEKGFMPVVAPPASDGKDGFLNVNADLAAATLAAALNASKLVFLTGAPGILRNAEDKASLVSALCLAELDALEDSGAIKAGMKVKSAAIRAALKAGVERVHVVSGVDDDALLGELYTTQGEGTLITRQPERAPDPQPVCV